jgi:sugar phosphate isomerase/epimerase
MPSYTRRGFHRLFLSALPAAGVLTAIDPLRAAQSRPDSRVAGVQIGLNVPYSFGKMAMTADEIREACVRLGFSGVELRTQPVEAFMGAPYQDGKPDPAAIRPWREGAAMDKARVLKSAWSDAGVKIEIVKVDGLFKMSDAELDYVFNLAKTLGARAISTEISKSDDELKRVGQFADRRRLMVGYHGHAATGPEEWERAFSLAKFNGANVDIGHFVAGDHGSPVPFLEKHHARVTHVHIKDRRRGNGPNVPFGQGDTPIMEVLRLIRDRKWPIQATIEFEYPVPAGSDRMTELARSLKYCRDALG